MSQKTHVKYWTLFFDDYESAHTFMQEETSSLREYGVIPRKEELKSLKNGDWYWQMQFNKPMYQTEIETMIGGRGIRFRPTNQKTPNTSPNVQGSTQVKIY